MCVNVAPEFFCAFFAKLMVCTMHEDNYKSELVSVNKTLQAGGNVKFGMWICFCFLCPEMVAVILLMF